MNQNYGEAYKNRGLAYYSLGDYNKALADFQKAIELLPTSAATFSNSGLAHHALNDYAEALSDYSKAIKLESRFARAYYNRGITYAAIGDYEKAIADFDNAILYTPEGTSSLWKENSAEGDPLGITSSIASIIPYANLPLVYLNRGSVYALMENYERAITDFDKAIDLQPTFALAYYDRGATYHFLGDYDKATADLEKVMELNNNPSVQAAAEGLLNKLTWSAPEISASPDIPVTALANEDILVWYDFEDNFVFSSIVTDRSGNGFDAQVVNGTVDATNGISGGQAISFSGDGYLQALINPVAGRNEVAFSFWFKTDHPEIDAVFASAAS